MGSDRDEVGVAEGRQGVRVFQEIEESRESELQGEIGFTRRGSLDVTRKGRRRSRHEFSVTETFRK